MRKIAKLTALACALALAMSALTPAHAQEVSNFGFRNPVLPGFHADPSVCRKGSDYYLVNSTFQFFPGVPVYHSKDLVHWQQIGACLTRKSQVDLTGTDELGGIYAPTIRYHEGRFYMVTTVFPSRQHFYVYTDDPAGEWSEPVNIPFVKGSCDPTLFFDDGKCYFIWSDDGIKICEIDITTGNQLSEIRRLWSGQGGRYPEGPHLYKKDGYYYLMLAEGGTEHGHHVNIARSRYVYGPYTPCPANPILSHFSEKMQNSPIQGLGHADLVQAEDGSWWMICLGYRTHGYLQHVMGRETFLAPVRWDEGAWPVVNRDGTLQLDMRCPTLPQVIMPQAPEKDQFDAPRLGWEWSYLCNPDSSCYSLAAHKGYLRLTPGTTLLSEKGSPTFVAKRQTEARFCATAAVDVSGLKDGNEVGLAAYASSISHYAVQVSRQGGENRLQAVVHLGQMNHVECSIPLKERKVYLRVEADPQYYHLKYSTDDRNYTELCKMEFRFLSTETLGGFVGTHLALFAQRHGDAVGYADVDWMELKSVQ